MSNIVYDKKLVRLLSNQIIDRSDLDFLVDIILGTYEKNKYSIEGSRCSIDNATKNALKKIKIYSYYNDESLALLVYEFQTLSSNSIVNAVKKITSSDLKSYDEIKEELFSEKIITKETLDVFLKTLSAIEKNERKQMILDYFKDSHKGHSKILVDGILATGFFKLARNAFPYIGGAIAAFDLISISAYNKSAIIPFVIQIEWIRYCLKNDIYKHPDLVLNQGDTENKDGLSIKGCTVDNNTLNTIKENKIKKILSSKFSSILRESSNNYSNLKTITTEYVLIDVPFDSLVNSKEISGAKRGFMHGLDKKISGQANFTKASSTTAVVSSIINLTSFAVGQYELSQINNGLEKIKAEIEFLKGLYFSTDRSVINNLKDNIHSAVEIFLEKNVDLEKEIDQLIKSRTEIEEIIQKYEKECDKCLDNLNKIEPSLWGSNDLTDEILQIHDSYSVFIDILNASYLSIIYLGCYIHIITRENKKYSEKYTCSLKLIKSFLEKKLGNDTSIFAKSKEIREFIKRSKSILSSPLQKPQTDLANFLAIDSSFEYSCSIVNSIENKTQKILQNDFIPNDDVKLLGRINSELALEDLYLIPDEDIVISTLE